MTLSEAALSVSLSYFPPPPPLPPPSFSLPLAVAFSFSPTLSTRSYMTRANERMYCERVRARVVLLYVEAEKPLLLSVRVSCGFYGVFLPLVVPRAQRGDPPR